MEVQYNAEGLISKLIDSFGRFTNYSYIQHINEDKVSYLLHEIAFSDGSKTNYFYNSGYKSDVILPNNPLFDGQLNWIKRSTGENIFIDYDIKGRIISLRNGGDPKITTDDEQINFSFDDFATINTTIEATATGPGSTTRQYFADRQIPGCIR